MRDKIREFIFSFPLRDSRGVYKMVSSKCIVSLFFSLFFTGISLLFTKFCYVNILTMCGVILLGFVLWLKHNNKVSRSFIIVMFTTIYLGAYFIFVACTLLESGFEMIWVCLGANICTILISFRFAQKLILAPNKKNKKRISNVEMPFAIASPLMGMAIAHLLSWITSHNIMRYIGATMALIVAGMLGKISGKAILAFYYSVRLNFDDC